MKAFLKRNTKLLLGFLILLTVILIIPPPQNKSCEMKPLDSNIEPKGVRLTIADDPTDSAIITWYTEKQAQSPEIVFSKKSTLNDGETVKADGKNVEGTYIYSASLKNLESNTTYYYRVMDSSKIYNFTTAEERDVDHIEFLVLGDTQKVKDVTANITAKAMEKFGNEVDFLVHMGDIVDDGSDQEWYNEYFSEMEHLHSRYPCYFTEGNHENGLLTKMYDNLPLPSNGRDSRYYSFNWGPAGFLSLNDNNAEVLPHQKMPLLWLNNELTNFEKDKYTLWKFAYMHQPIFNAKASRSDKTELAATWASMFDSHSIDIVFQGHNHYYQRTYPMSHKGKVDDSSTTKFDDPQYPMYITSNTDAKQYSVSDGNPDYQLPGYVYYHNKTTEIMYIEILVDEESKETTLSAETWAIPQKENDQGEIAFLLDMNLSLIDNFEITKDIPENYLDPNYKTPDLTSYSRMPDFIYFILYFGVLGLVMILFERKTLQRYYEYKKATVLDHSKKSGTKDISGRQNKPDLKTMILSTVLSIVLMVGFAFGLYIVDIIDEILAIALGIFVGLIVKAPVNYFLYKKNKNKALNSFSHAFFYLGFAIIIAVVIFGFNFLYYLFYLNFIFLGISTALIIAANLLSKNIKISKVSGEKSFYLGGSLLFYANILIFVAGANLIALF